MEGFVLKMRQKHLILRYGKMFLAFGIVVPMVCIGISLLPGAETSRYVMWPLMALHLASVIVFFRKILLLSVSRVMIDESGITAKVMFRKNVEIRWGDLRRCGFTCMDTTGGLYNQQWFCFADSDRSIPKSIKSLFNLPYPDEHCIYIVYSEFIWEVIIKYAEPKTYSEALFKSREIV